MGYLKEKLSDILLAMQIHPENANIRLSSQHGKIMFLKAHPDIPKQYLKEFNSLTEILENNQDVYSRLYKIPYMHKKTAAKYIKLLMDIYDRL